MKRFPKILLGALLTGFVSMVPLSAAEANGFITVSYPSNNTLLIIDTNSKKILMYDVDEGRGITLKEVRDFSKALEAPSFHYSKGLNGKDERTKLAQILKSAK